MVNVEYLYFSSMAYYAHVEIEYELFLYEL